LKKKLRASLPKHFWNGGTLKKILIGWRAFMRLQDANKSPESDLRVL
jgi:hypothetical protein